MLPNLGVGKHEPKLEQSPQRAPRPNKKFFIVPHPVLVAISVAAIMIDPMRIFILVSLTCIASVFVDLEYQTLQKYDAIGVVQTQHRFF